jgi:hypothetical protein
LLAGPTPAHPAAASVNVEPATAGKLADATSGPASDNIAPVPGPETPTAAASEDRAQEFASGTPPAPQTARQNVATAVEQVPPTTTPLPAAGPKNTAVAAQSLSAPAAHGNAPSIDAHVLWPAGMTSLVRVM